MEYEAVVFIKENESVVWTNDESKTFARETFSSDAKAQEFAEKLCGLYGNLDYVINWV